MLRCPVHRAPQSVQTQLVVRSAPAQIELRRQGGGRAARTHRDFAPVLQLRTAAQLAAVWQDLPNSRPAGGVGSVAAHLARRPDDPSSARTRGGVTIELWVKHSPMETAMEIAVAQGRADGGSVRLLPNSARAAGVAQVRRSKFAPRLVTQPRKAPESVSLEAINPLSCQSTSARADDKLDFVS